MGSAYRGFYIQGSASRCLHLGGLDIHGWGEQTPGILRDTVNERAICILLECILVTGRNEVVAKVMFLHVSVILLTGGISGEHPPPRTKENPTPGPRRNPPGTKENPPRDQGEPLPPGTKETPPPGEEHCSIRSMSCRYASYWNAFLLRNENWPRSMRFEPIFIAGISSSKQAETSTEIQSEPTKSSASAPRVNKVPIKSTELENNDNGTSSTVSHGCRTSAQTLLFCEAMREANFLSFNEEEVRLDSDRAKITFRNKTFPIILPVKILRACYKLQPRKVRMCNMLTSQVEKGAKFSKKKEQYYLQVIYFVIMNIMPPSGKKYDAGHIFPTSNLKIPMFRMTQRKCNFGRMKI